MSINQEKKKNPLGCASVCVDGQNEIVTVYNDGLCEMESGKAFYLPQNEIEILQIHQNRENATKNLLKKSKLITAASVDTTPWENIEENLDAGKFGLQNFFDFVSNGKDEPDTAVHTENTQLNAETQNKQSAPNNDNAKEDPAKAKFVLSATEDTQEAKSTANDNKPKKEKVKKRSHKVMETFAIILLVMALMVIVYLMLVQYGVIPGPYPFIEDFWTSLQSWTESLKGL